MASWIVFTRNDDAAADAVADRAVFVRDGFSWLALLFGPVVLLWHGLWLAFVVYVAIAVGLQLAVMFAHVPDMVPTIVMTGVNVLLALDLAVLRSRKLMRQGYVEETVVSGRNRITAEQRFFDQWQGTPAIRPTPRPASPPSPPAPPALRPGLIEGPPAWRLAQGQASRQPSGQPRGPVIGSLDTGNSGA